MTPFLVALYPWRLLVKQIARASNEKPEVQAYLLEAFQTVAAKVITKIFLETAACLQFEEDYRINKPMLLVCGEQDNTGNIKQMAPE